MVDMFGLRIQKSSAENVRLQRPARNALHNVNQ
jgi:hypothetical protein